MRERCVIFVENEQAKLYGRQSNIVLPKPEYAYTTLHDGMYPISPMDIRAYFYELPVCQGLAIVELYVERNDLGTVQGFNRKDVISVNLNMGGDLLVPHRMFWPSCMFRKDTHVLSDTLGWERPMAGITLLRNKQCMAPEAYSRLLGKLANGQGEEIERYVEKIMLPTYLDEETVSKYRL